MAVQDSTDRRSTGVDESPRYLARLPLVGVLFRSFSHTFESLENRNYRLLWLGMVFAMGGFQMQMVVRGIFVYDLTGDRIITSMVALGFAPSLLLVSLYGGVLGDRMERRLIIQLSQASNGLCAAIVAVLMMTELINWGHLFAVSMAQGAMFAFQMPARQAAIPSLVSKSQLPNAFALNAMAMSIMTLGAPAIGGILYDEVGAVTVYWIVSGIMLGSVIFTSLVPRMYPPETDKQSSVVDNIIAGFKYIGRNKIVLNLMIYSVIVALLSMPFRMLVQVYAKDIYESDGSEVGLLLTALGLGGLIGSVSIANLRQGHHRGWILLGGAFIAGGSLALIVGLPYFAAGMFGMVGLGLGEQARWALGQSLMMENADDKYRARVMSVLMMTFGLMPLGTAPMGFAMDELGGRLAVAIYATALLAFAVYSVLFMARLRKLE